MKSNETHIELFDQYLLNQLGEVQKKAFEERLSNEPNFKEEFEIHKILVQGIQQHGREELKNFLKENATINFWGGNIWPKQMRVASVAVFLLFAGMYVLIHFYLQPKSQGNNTAIITEKSTELDVNNITKDDTVPVPPATEVPNTLSNVESMEIEIPVIEDEIQNPSEEIDMMEKETESELATKQLNDYQVLNERKLSDTVLFVMNIPVNNALKEEASIKVVKKSKSPTIPSNTQNSPLNNNAGQLNLDTSANVKYENSDKKGLSKKVSASVKYQIEFWTSPINFKGYKLINQTLQLYGLSNNQVQLKMMNNQLYLIHKQTVYVLNTCVDGCAYKPLNDEELESILLNKN